MNKHKYTWVQQRLNLELITDHIITKYESKIKILNVQEYMVAICGRDQCVVRKTYVSLKLEIQIEAFISLVN